MSEQTERPREQPTTIRLAIQGMTCASCVRRVERAITAVPGVAEASVNLATEEALVQLARPDIALDELLAAVERAGYHASPLVSEPSVSDSSEATVELGIEGMTCASCVRRVERALLAVPGVHEAVVNLANERAFVRFDPTRASIDRMLRAVEEAGYRAVVVPAEIPMEEVADAAEQRRARELARLRWDVILASALAAPVVAVNMLMPASPWVGLLLLVLTVPVWGYFGRRFHLTALRNLRHGQFTMDTLVSLGTSAAFFSSL
ncbi:MAG: copper ion binding protein, partial [Thermomicrobium sp.]